MADDFFVRFGSDAAAFGRKLDQDLAPARRAIGNFAKQLQDIETQTANRRAATMKHLAAMSTEADRVQRKLDNLASAHQAAGVSPEVSDVRQMAAAAYQDIGQLVNGLDGVLLRLKGAADQLDRFDKGLAAERTAQNRSAAQQQRNDQLRDPATGRIVGQGAAGAVPLQQVNVQRLIQQAVQAARTGGGVQLSQIPQATIDEAAFQRVVTAVERNVTATERVEQAIDRLGARLPASGDAGTASPAAMQEQARAVAQEVAVAQQRESGPNARQQGLDKTITQLAARERELRQETERLAREMQEGAQVSEVFGRNLNELAEVEKRLASARTARANDESRAEQQERQRRAARQAASEQAGIAISPEERRFRQDERARLELAANPDALQGLVGRGKGQLGKSGLMDIAETLGRQGYPVDFGATRGDTGLPRASVERMLEQITAAGREYLATGRATADDLSARRVERPPTELSTDVQNLLGGDLPRVAQRFTRELGRLGISVEQAYQLIGASMRSGGQDPRQVRRRGRLEVGAEIGDELRDSVRAAPDIISAYDRERRAAARGDVLSAMRGNQQFNPYDQDLRAPGRDDTAKQARRDIAAMLRATQEIDQFAANLGELDDGLRRAQQVQARVLRALDAYERLDRKPTGDEAAEYTRNLARAEQASTRVGERRQRLEQEMSLFKDPTGGNAQFLLEPGFREGLRRRQESRERAEAEAESTRQQSQERFLGRAALRDATFEYLGKARTFVTSQGNSTDYFERTLPGVRAAGQPGRQRFAFSDDEMMKSPENRRALGQMTAGILGYTRHLNDLIDEISEGDRSEAQLNETREKVTRALTKLLSGYMSAFPGTFPNGMEDASKRFLPPQLMGGYDTTSAAESLRRERVTAQVTEEAVRKAASSGGGAGGAGKPPVAAGADEPSRGRGGILAEILAALNRIDGRLKGTIRVSGSVSPSGEGAGSTIGTRGPARSTAQGRADFESAIGASIPAVGQLLSAGRDVEAAAELVARGVLSETRVLELFRDKLGQTAAEAKKFQASVRGAAGDRRLADAAAAAEGQQAKQRAQQFQTRGGESLSIQQARAAMREDLSARKRQEDQVRRTGSEERRAAAAALVHAQAMAKLSAETKHEIAELERMARGSDQSAEAQQRLAAQMAKVYGMAAREMRGRSTETNQAVGQIYKGAGIDVTGEEVASMRNTARSFGYQVDHSAAQNVAPGGIFGEQSEFTRAMFGNHGFWSRVMSSTGTFVVRNFTAGFVFGLTNALQDLMTQAIQAEAIFVRVSDALEETGQSTVGLRSDLRGLAVDYGVALQDVYETAAGLTGLFDNTEDLKGGVEVVTQLQRISMGALNAQEAMGILSATIGGFGQELGTGVDAMTHVADVLTTIQNNLGVNVETSSEGVSAMAGLAQQLKIDFEDAAVYVSQIAKLTNQTGAGAGEGFSRVLAAMQTGRGRQVLTQALPELAAPLEGGEYGQVLHTLVSQWDGLSDAQQRNIAVTLGGQRQARVVAALFSDTAKVLDTTAKAHDASGEAAKRNQEIMNTMNAQVGVLQANMTALADNLLDSGIANSVAVILKGINLLLGGVNDLLNLINTFGDDHAFVGTLLTWGTALGGLLLMIGLISKSLTGLKASMAAMRALTIGEAVGGAAGVAGGVSERGVLRSGGAAFIDGPLGVAARAESASVRASERAAAAGTARAAAGYNLLAKGGNLASRASLGVASGFQRIASAGIGAQIALGLASAAVVLLISDVMAARARDKQFRDQADKDFNADGSPKSAAQKASETYLGPYSEGARNNRNATMSYGSTLRNLVTAPFQAGNLTSGAAWKGSLGDVFDRIDGIVPEDAQADLDKLHFEALSKIHDQIQMPVQTAEAVQRTNDEVAEMIRQAQQDILGSDMSDQQKQAALAELEQSQAGFEGIFQKLRIKAEGLTALDSLTTTQITEISELMGAMQGNLATGDSQVSQILSGMVDNEGLNTNGRLYKNLQQLSKGGLDSAEALKLQSENISDQLKNANAKYESMLTEGTGDAEEVASQKQLVLSLAAQLVSTTEQQLQAIISDANTIADLQSSRGNFSVAARGINQALSRFHAGRSANESPTTRASNDLLEAQGAERVAQATAEGQNLALETAKARGAGSEEAAQLDAQIARNTYEALLQARKAAQSAGREGPSVRAIAEAKNAWLQAQRSSLLAAQSSDIAQLALEQARQWNALAAGGIQEQIALQQYNDAVSNFGANSTEATQAATQLVQTRHQNQQTQDQVAAAQRDAMLAAIPRGNTLAIARQTLANAHAALAAAQKYGQNSTEYQSALAQVAAANQGLLQAESDMLTSRLDVAVALAEAAGKTVKAAALRAQQARDALTAALRSSGGADSPEVRQARAALITAEAATRDAKLQDQLDTIDFNLQMNKITQGGAISALRNILRTNDLTKAQRRQLLLQIKGMQDSLADTQWNFGDIKLPSRYQMRRYIEQNRRNMQEAGQRVGSQFQDAYASGRVSAGAGGGSANSVVNNNQTTTITINANRNLREVEEVVNRAVGKGHRVRTAQPRRR